MAITEIDYMEYSSDANAQSAYVTNGLNDVYGSDVCNSGTASADSVSGPYPVSNAFDNNESTFWNSDTVTDPHWLKYDLGSGVTKTVRKLRIKNYLNNGFDTFKLQGSNNDSDWTDIYSGDASAGTTWQDFTFSNSTAYRYYKILEVSSPTVDLAIYEIEMMEIVGSSLQSYSESSIKTQGSYALKGVAAQTDSLNKTLTKTLSPTVDLSGMNSAKFDIRSSRTGQNIKVGLYEGVNMRAEVTTNIASANVFQTETIDLSAVSDANKDAIDKVVITIVEAAAQDIFYIDNMYATTSTAFIPIINIF